MYYYFDNWNGGKKEFASLRDAKTSAKNETGVSIAVIKKDTNKIIHVPASGYTPS